VSPELGAAYNGIQGDLWDAQKDAGLAMVGAILCMIGTALWPRRVATSDSIHPAERETTPHSSVAMDQRRMDLFLEAAIYVWVLSLASFLWEWPVVLLLCFVATSALMLLRWHRRSDVFFYVAGFVLGPLGEAMAVHFNAWQYSKPFFLVPVWLPCLWGIAALFVKRLCDTLLRTK